MQVPLQNTNMEPDNDNRSLGSSLGPEAHGPVKLYQTHTSVAGLTWRTRSWQKVTAAFFLQSHRGLWPIAMEKQMPEGFSQTGISSVSRQVDQH